MTERDRTPSASDDAFLELPSKRDMGDLLDGLAEASDEGAKKRRTVRNIKVFAVVVVVWLLLEFGGWSTYDYGLHCTRCALRKRVVEKHLFGCTVYRREGEATPAQDYERLFGHPCEHVF